MNSVTPSDKAANWQTLNGKDLDREKEDQENLEFCDARELVFRRKCKKAREDVTSLEERRSALEEIVERTKRLRRTEVEYWEEGDLDFWIRYTGIYFSK